MSDETPFAKAVKDLGLSPQEQNLYLHHLDNLYGEGKVVHPGGEISTLYQTVAFGSDGLYHNIPTVWNGQILDRVSAAQLAAQHGWSKWPGYATPEQADLRYDTMHKYIEDDTINYQRTRR